MKLFVVLCVITVALAAPPPSATKSLNNVELLRYNNDNKGLGKYSFGFEQSDGTKQEQFGELKSNDNENPFLEVRGTFTWIGPDGVTYNVTYVANKDGYQPEIEQGPGVAIPAGVLASMTG